MVYWSAACELPQSGGSRGGGDGGGSSQHIAEAKCVAGEVSGEGERYRLATSFHEAVEAEAAVAVEARDASQEVDASRESYASWEQQERRAARANLRYSFVCVIGIAREACGEGEHHVHLILILLLSQLLQAQASFLCFSLSSAWFYSVRTD